MIHTHQYIYTMSRVWFFYDLWDDEDGNDVWSRGKSHTPKRIFMVGSIVVALWMAINVPCNATMRLDPT